MVKVYKGTGIQKEVHVHSLQNLGANCGIEMKKDSGMYLVFAGFDVGTGRLEMSSCSVGYVSESDGRTLALIRDLNAL